jgi:hypothetical protein
MYGRAYGCQLLQDRLAVASILQHALHAAYLALDAFQPALQVMPHFDITQLHGVTSISTILG